MTHSYKRYINNNNNNIISFRIENQTGNFPLLTKRKSTPTI